MKKIVSHSDDVEKEAVERGEGISIQWLIGEDQDVDYYLRKFTFDIGGKMPYHQHKELYHEEYILKGRVKATIDKEEYEVDTGDFLLIPKGVPHSYENIGDEKAQFLCIIPAIKDRHTEILEE